MNIIGSLLARFRQPVAPAENEEAVERQERQDWMDRRGFKLCFDQFEGRYVPGFDRNRQYEFMRPEWESPSVFRMADMHPAFNIWGLRFRPLD